MTKPNRAKLLTGLADGLDLATAAQAAGFEDAAAAAKTLRELATKPPSKSRRRADDPAQALPPKPPKSSPFPKGQPGIAHSDGASRGNPGPAAYGCAYLAQDGTPLCGEGEAIGRATNNVAEYRGAIAALRRLSGWGMKEIILRLDSQLVVRQLDGSYRVKDAGLKPLHAEASALLSHFRSHRLEYVPRKQNALADALANRALDGKEGD